MFGLGFPELLLILIIVIVVFGGKRLPEIGAGIGKGISNFKKSMKDADTEKNGEKINDKKESDS